MTDVTADAIYRHIGEKMREARESQGTTQHVLASRANLTRASVSNIEAGRQRVTIHALLAMAAALEVSPEELLPDLGATPSTDVDVLVDRGALREEAEAFVRVFRGRR